MNLSTIPFSPEEEKRSYKITQFEELGINLNFLSDINQTTRKLPSGNSYKFGVISNRRYFWYFNGEPIKQIKGQRVYRAKMREIFSILLQFNQDNPDNIPFIFKEINR